MNLNDYDVIELDDTEKNENVGGSWISYALGWVAETLVYMVELSALQGGTAGGRAGAWGCC